jgi:hypothetical protein
MKPSCSRDPLPGRDFSRAGQDAHTTAGSASVAPAAYAGTVSRAISTSE